LVVGDHGGLGFTGVHGGDIAERTSVFVVVKIVQIDLYASISKMLN
jgi:hypothetical protein